MGTITTTDGTEIFYKTGGSGQPIVFSHGWPLSAHDWDTQMMFFLLHGYRVVAHDRRGHGRSTQTNDGHDMDHYADDLAAVTEHLDLHDAIHVGHSTGGGEVVRYLARYGKPGGEGGADQLCAAADAEDRGQPRWPAQGCVRRAPGPDPRRAGRNFTGPSRPGRSTAITSPGAKPSEAIIDNWWRQGMMGGAKAHYDGIVAFSQTDFTEDLKGISARPGAARRRRPGRSLGRLRAADGEAGAERDAEDLSPASRTACPRRKRPTVNADLLPAERVRFALGGGLSARQAWPVSAGRACGRLPGPHR